MAELPSFRAKQKVKEKWELMSPESKVAESDVLATRIQKVWKGHQTRKEYKWIIDKCKAKSKHKEYVAAAQQIKSGIKTVSAKTEQEGRKSEERRRRPITESPMSAKKRPGNLPKDTKETDEARKQYRRTVTALGPYKAKRKDESPLKQREEVPSSPQHTPAWEIKKADTIRFVQRVILQEVIDRACMQGESLILSKQVQTKFENRPVNKDVFVFSHEFQYPASDPLVHSLHCVNSLGRIIYLESMGSLQQVDITSEKHLSSYFLGVRMPLKYTPLIDMVCDTKSCRVYTLNALWKLEVWSLEQDSSLPLKRVPMVNCEITRDHIKSAYKARFCQAKPTFLALTDSANQILVVNTSCVDGNIAFVDPISLSILRRIHFRFSEYEVPVYIREAIVKLKNVLHAAFHSEQESIIGIMNKIGKKKGSNEMSYEEFVASLRSLCQEIDSSLLYDICKQIDINNNGFISLEELTPYIDEDQSRNRGENKRGTDLGSWPEWLVSENKVYLAKQILGKVIDSIERLGLDPLKAFSIFDPDSAGIVESKDFSRVLSKLCPEAVVDEIDLITRIADSFHDRKIRYGEFCKLLNRKALQSDMGIEEVERLLREPLVHRNDLPTLLRKCFENGINLREIFKAEDVFRQGLISRERLYQILEGLPLGYSPQDIYDIFKSSAIFDAHGNADYTLILQHDAYVILEKMHSTEEETVEKPPVTSERAGNVPISPRSYSSEPRIGGGPKITGQRPADPRKVVVEDMVYIDDFDIVVYTTVFPKSSNIYISHTVPMQGPEIILRPKTETPNKSPSSPRTGQSQSQEVLKYQFLATLKGHVNNSPPTIYYVDETCCLISGEKDEADQQLEEMAAQEEVSSIQAKATALVTKLRTPTKRAPKEILIWNLQKDLVHMMQANPPWQLRPARRISAHEGSILDIVYLRSAQLIVTASTDQTVRFFDPVAEPYALSDPKQFPVGGPQMPSTAEFTATNQTFREVKRIYTAPAVCYKLQTLTLAAGKVGENGTSATKPGMSPGSVEWIVGLKLGAPEGAGSVKQLQGVVAGYGIERVRLIVPAVRHDDPVPEVVFQRCEGEVADRRKRAIVLFQSVLPHNLEYLLANVTLRASQMKKVAGLFKEATLNRKGGRYVSPDPLKEVFKVLLEIPERKKYGHLMKDKERSITLSVSEVYFYLKKYSQIHPTNLSQLMFAKLVKALKEELEKSATHAGHKWYSEALNAYAAYIRKNGVDRQMLIDYADDGHDYLTREQFVAYLKSLELGLEETQYESVAHEVDALNTGRVTIPMLEGFFAEELRHFNITMFRRPTPIIAEIRAKALPSKKLRLQEALGAVDRHGDGYLTKKQFLEAFERAEVDVDQETLTYLFDMMGEKYLPRENEKVLSVAHFMNKMLTEEEGREVSEMTAIISKVSASLAYRGISPEVVFSDVSAEKLNLTILPEKLKEVLSATEFVQRIESLHIVHLTPGEIAKLSNYLAVNEKNERIQVIYLRNYLHHIKNASAAPMMDAEALKYLVAVLCGKLLVSETRFKRQCYELADITNSCIEPAGLRAVLLANNVLSKHADLLVETLMGNAGMNLEDLVARMRAEAALYYKPRYQSLSKTDSKLLRGVPQINFHEALKACFSADKTENGTSPERLISICRGFDKRTTGKIKIFHMLNILRHNVPGADERILAGLQYELTVIHPDEQIAYAEFLGAFTAAVNEATAPPTSAEERQQAMKSEYDLVLQKVDDYLSKNRIDVQKAFSMFDSDLDGSVTEEEMKKALSWTDLVLKPEELDCLCKMAPKDRESGNVRYRELISAVEHSGDLVTAYNKQQWASAAKGISLEDQCRVIADNMDQFKFLLQKEYPESTQIVPGEVFMNCMRDANFGLTEEEIAMVAKYAIRGSKRLTQEQQNNILSAVSIDLSHDLINVPFFEQSLAAAFATRSESKEDSGRPRVLPNAEIIKKIGKRKEAEMVNKVKAYFTKTGLSFYDYFLAEDVGFLQSQLQYMIAESVRVLKIPLTLQEQRLLQQLEDPFSQNNIPVRSFCDRFETIVSLEKRMKSALERMTAAILLKDIAWDLAFDLFDKENKGYISRENFYDLINYWKLGLTTLEIEIMLQLIGEQRNNEVIVTREMFKDKIINSLQNLKEVVVQKLKQSLLLELHERLNAAGPGHSLRQLFAARSTSSGIATVEVLREVLEQLGIRGVTKKELQITMDAGGVTADEQDAGFIFSTFCTNIERAVDGEVRRRGDSTSKIVEKLFIVMRAKKMSVFDAYCLFDVFLRGGITRLELMSGLQSMGIESSQENITILWTTVMNESGAGSDKMSYHTFLTMFVKRGLLKVTEPESAAAMIAAEFTKKLRASEVKLDALFNLMDSKRAGRATKQDFTVACRKAGVVMSGEELQVIYDIVEDKQAGGITYKGLADFVQEGSKDEDKLIRIYTRIHRVSQRRKVDWDSAFKQQLKDAKDKKSKSSSMGNSRKKQEQDDGLDSHTLAVGIRKQRLGLKAEEIELAVNHLIYSASGTISTKAFEDQLADWVNKYVKKREEKIVVLKSFMRKLGSALKKPDAKLETTFAEMDRDEDGALTSFEFFGLLERLGLDTSAKDAASIFGILTAESMTASVSPAAGAMSKLKLDTLKRYMTSFELVDQLDEGDGEETQQEDEREIVFQKIRAKLEEKDRTIQQIMAKLRVNPVTHITLKAMRKIFDNVDLALTDREINLVDEEIRKTYSQDQYSYQVFLDFMVRRRVDSSEIYSGTADPGIVFCLQAISKALKRNGVDHGHAFDILSAAKGAFIAKVHFIQGVEGMQLGLSLDDIVALFTSLDKTKSNTVSKASFLQSLVYASQVTVGGPEEGKTIATAQNLQNMKVNHVLKQLAENFEKSGYSLRQIASIFDVHGTGVLTKAELATLLRERDIAVSLNDVRTVSSHFASQGDGKIFAGSIVARIQELLNQDTEGRYSMIQAKPIVKKIQHEIEGSDFGSLSDEILKYDKQIGEDMGRSGIDKKYFYRILGQFKVCLSEEEKTILNTAFELHEHKDMMDTRRLLPMLEPVGTQGQRYTLEWEQKIYRKLGDFLRKKGKTLMDCFDMEGSEGTGYTTQEELAGYLRNLQVNLTEREINSLLALTAVERDGKVKLKDFVKKFYDAYLLDAESLATSKMSKEEEAALVTKVIRKMKTHEGCTCEKAFAWLDSGKIGYLTVAGLQFGFPKFFDIHFTKDQLLVLIKYMDFNGDGVITLKEFTHFYQTLEQELKPKEEMHPEKELTLEGIFDSLLDVLKERHLTLMEIFEQLDVNQNGYISIEEFVGLLQTIGYVISEEKAGALFRKAEASFDGKISYMLLYKYVKMVSAKYGIVAGEDAVGDQKLFAWRDRAVEGLTKALNSLGRTHIAYFEGFDTNRDGILSPKEFREALRYLKSVGPSQAERLLSFLAADREHQPCVIIEKLVNFLQQYSTNPFYTRRQTGAEELLVDEDLFVSIVQHFDGFNVLNEKTYQLAESASYLASHRQELKSRGCAILANDSMLIRLVEGAKSLALSLRDTLVGVSNTCLELIKGAAREELLGKPADSESAKVPTLLDTTMADSCKIPEIDPRSIQVDKESRWILPSGCTCYKGTFEHQKRIQIQVYNTQMLNRVSADGQVYRKHLELELAAQTTLFSRDPTATFRILGKYEKKTGIGESSVELYIVFEDILPSEYASLAEFLATNGGLLQMPLLRGTEAALYVAKIWAIDLLHILTTLHSAGFVMHSLSPSHVYLSKSNSRLRMGHFRGVGRLDPTGKLRTCPDLGIHAPENSSTDALYDSPYLPPELLLSPAQEHTTATDAWSFGGILLAALVGTPPMSYYKAYKSWAELHETKQIEFSISALPLVEPGPQSFIYDPVSALGVNATINHGEERFVRELDGTRDRCDNTIHAMKAASYSGVVEGKSWLAPFKQSGKKSVLGLMLDVVLCCLDVRPQNRPDLNKLMESKVFRLDHYERASAGKFARSVPLYKSPTLCISEQSKLPLRNMCATALRHPEKLLTELEGPIIAVVEAIAQYIHTIATPHTNSIQQVLLDQSQGGASPHAPLARQIVRDRIVDMLVFLAHRYTRQWMIRHQDEYLKECTEAEDFARKTCSLIMPSDSPAKNISAAGAASSTIGIAAAARKSGRKFLDYSEIQNEKARKAAEERDTSERARRKKEKAESQKRFEQSLTRSQKAISLRFRERNRVLSAVCSLVHELVVEMQFRDSVMAPYVDRVIEYMVKLMIGEDFMCASDLVAMEAEPMRNILGLKTFHESDDTELKSFVPDALDKEWHKQHENRSVVSYDSFWSVSTYNVVLPIYQEAIGIGGLGGGQYPVIHEYIQSCNTTAEVYSMFGKSATRLYGNFMIPAARTSEYYSELLKLCDTICILASDGYSDETKRSSLGSLCGTIYSGDAERIKAAVDLRVTRYLHPLLQHPDEETRKLALLTFYQFSRAIADEETLSLLSLEPVQVFMKENVAPTASPSRGAAEYKKKTLPDPAKDLSLVSYIYGETAVNSPIDTRRYLGFAHELPTVHFQQNRPLFYALAKALESPVFSSLLLRLLKSHSETSENKILTLRILANLFTAGPMMLRSLNSAVTDCYLTLAKVLQRAGSKDPLHHEVKSLFSRLFELRDSTINAALISSSARDLLRDAGLSVPTIRSLPELIEFSESLLTAAAPDEEALLKVYSISAYCKDIKALLLHSQTKPIDLMGAEKMMRLAMETTARIADIAWEYAKLRERTPDRKDTWRRLMHVVRTVLDFWDWLASANNHTLIVNAKGGKLIEWLLVVNTALLSKCTGVLESEAATMGKVADSARRTKAMKQELAESEDLQLVRRLSIRIQHLFSLLLRANEDPINEMLEALNFGQTLGLQLQLQYEQLKLGIDSGADAEGTLDLYAEQNSNRLAAVEWLLRSNSRKLQAQFLKSRFLERMTAEYIKDTRQFSAKFNKIDLKFLAFGRSYPLRNESMGVISLLLRHRNTAPELFTELIQRLNMHQVVAHECEIIKGFETEPELRVQTALLFFAMMAGEGEAETVRGDERVTAAIKEILERKSMFRRQFASLLGKLNSAATATKRAGTA